MYSLEDLTKQLSLSLARFSFRDSIDLDVIGDDDTTTSRIEADDEQSIERTTNSQQNQQKQQTKPSCSTPVAPVNHLNLPRSQLRNGKIFRKSYPSECRLNFKEISVEENQKNKVRFDEKNLEIDNKNKQLKNNTNTHTQQKSQNKEINIKYKMVDVGKINALIFNNIPILSCENCSNLKTEIHVFIRCCEYVESCLDADEKNTFYLLLRSRIRAKAAEVLDGVQCENLQVLKKTLIEKLLKSKPYHVLRGELQSLYQFPSESVESFGNRVECLLKQCKEAITTTDANGLRAIQSELEEQALYIFKSGINNINLRWFCLADTEQTLAALLQKAIKLESSERQSNCNNRFESSDHNSIHTNLNHLEQNASYQNSAQNLHNSNQTFNHNSTPFVQNFTQRNQPHIPLNNYQNTSMINRPENFIHQHEQYGRNNGYNSKRNNNIKCNFCGKNGHYFVDCRLRKNTPYCTNCKLYGHTIQFCKTHSTNSNHQRNVNNINKGKQSYERKNNTVCDFCKRHGHTINSCRAKQEWENKNGVQSSGN